MNRPGRIAIALILLLLLLVAPSLLRFYTDWLWFGEVGFQHVFGTILRTQGAIFTATFVLASAMMLVNEIIRNGVTGLAGLAVIAAGVPIYFAFARRLRK